MSNYKTLIEDVSHGKRILIQRHPKLSYDSDHRLLIDIYESIHGMSYKNEEVKYKLLDYFSILYCKKDVS